MGDQFRPDSGKNYLFTQINPNPIKKKKIICVFDTSLKTVLAKHLKK